MSPEALSRFDTVLRTLEAELEGGGPLKAEPNRTDDGGRRDEDHQPLNEMLQSITSSRNRNRAGVLRQVKQALARLKDEPEYFGLCTECEEPISERRLGLMPYAALCVPCQSELEEPIKKGRRRHLTDY